MWKITKTFFKYKNFKTWRKIVITVDRKRDIFSKIRNNESNVIKQKVPLFSKN